MSLHMLKIMTSVLMSICISYSSKLFAQDVKIDRRDYFKTAYSQMSFILSSLNHEGKFQEILNSEEKKMLRYVLYIADQNATFHWLTRNAKTEVFENQKIFFYIGTDVNTHNQELKIKYQDIEIQYTTPAQFKLQFSDDQSLFKINDGEATRSAMTVPPESLSNPNIRGSIPDLNDIYINLNRISASNTKITLTDALSILIHEFGHKLLDKKNQNAIDSLAAKVKAYIDQNFKKEFKTKNGKFFLYQLPLDFQKAWYEDLLKGGFYAVDRTFNYVPLRIYSDAGAYLFYESKDGVKDITKQLFTNVYRNQLLSGLNAGPVKWNLMQSYEITDLDFKTIDSKINLSYTLYSKYNPIILSSDNPRADFSKSNYLTRNYFSGSLINLSTTDSFNVLIDESEDISNIKPKIMVPTRIRPDIEVISISQEKTFDTLKLEFQIKDYKNKIENFEPLEAKILLNLKSDTGVVYDIIGEHVVIGNDIGVSFKIKNYYTTPIHFVKANIDIISKKPNFTYRPDFARERIEIAKYVELFNKTKFLKKEMVKTFKNKFYLKYAGLDRNIEKKVEAENILILNFKSDAKINQLTLRMIAPVLSKISNVLHYGGRQKIAPEEEFIKASLETDVIFDKKSMHQQKLPNGLLEVRINLNHQVKMDSLIGWRTELTDYYKIGVGVHSETNQKLTTLPDWRLIALEATNESFEKVDFSFRDAAFLYKKQSTFEPHAASRKLKCSNLFNL